MPTLKSVKLLCYRVLRGAPLTPRTRYRSPFPFTELFHRDYSVLFIRFVSQPRSPQSSSVHVFSSVHHPRHLNHPPSSSPKPSFILVFSSVHRSRLRYRPPSRLPPSFSILVSGTILHPRHLNRPPSPFSAAQFFLDVTKKMCKKSLSLNNRVFFKITD